MPKYPLLAVVALAAVGLVAQTTRGARPSTGRQHPEWEVRILHPHEVAAGRYSQVRPYEIDQMAAEGWELVSVSTYVLRNEEHEGPKGERPMVTQAYLSYAFKRLKPER
ncbi:MAG: hypothetical protein IT162_18220 [Bryobacterales bacterium]|nr:hypothetical protein [Bryobacterales bacterium]